MISTLKASISRAQGLLSRFRDQLSVRQVSAKARLVHRVVLFEADWRGIFYFVRPLVRKMITDPNTFALIVSRRSEISAIEKALFDNFHAPNSKVSLISFEAFKRLQVEIDCLISCQPYSLVASTFSGIPKIQLLHGMADKRGELFGPQRLTDFTHLFSPAPVVTELARERLLGRDQPNNRPIEIVEIGCPKTDDLFDGTFERDQVLRSLGLPADRPTVLYAPTWEKEASLEQNGDRIVSALSELEINLLVKPHPLSLADRTDPFLIENGHGGKDWNHILEGWERLFSNLRWVQDPYANPYMVAADLLVSEGSGVAFEYVLLDKPIVFIDTPLVYERHGIDNLHHRLRACGTISPSVEDLCEVVRHHLDQTGLDKQDREPFVRQLAYNPGTAATAALGEIDRLLACTSRGAE
jgi:hypothetical protein